MATKSIPIVSNFLNLLAKSILVPTPSVQETIEIAISKVAPEKPEIQGAGRTDAGVHATGQIAHVDLNKFWDSFRLSEAINYHLRPAPISITKCSIVEDDFHARFSAKMRIYKYIIIIIIIWEFLDFLPGFYENIKKIK